MSAGGFVIVRLDGQNFGISVAQVRDVLRGQKITPVPLAPPAVAGLINLRGRIITMIDLRVRLGLPSRAASGDDMSIVVELGGEHYALAVDAVDDVTAIAPAGLEAVPSTLDPLWRDVATAVHAGARGLIVLLDIARVLDLAPPLRAAS